MKLDPNFIHPRKIKRHLDFGKLFARRAGSSRSDDVIVAATLLALLVVGTIRWLGMADGTGERRRPAKRAGLLLNRSTPAV